MHQRIVFASPIRDITIDGATRNLARFFRHYYLSGRPIDSLKLLAAHIILTGGRIDNTIDGLDMVAITRDGLVWIDGEEMKNLHQSSAALDASIRKQLGLA